MRNLIIATIMKLFLVFGIKRGIKVRVCVILLGNFTEINALIIWTTAVRITDILVAMCIDLKPELVKRFMSTILGECRHVYTLL